MKSIIFLMLFFLVGTASAEEYQMVVPFSPGNQTDSVARLLQESVQKNTNDRIVILNMPGAETLIGAQHFKNNRKIDMIIGSGSQSIWNPLIKQNIGYSDNDFRHVIFVGTTCAVWVTRPDTGLREPVDLLKKMPSLVGGFSYSHTANVVSLVKERGVQSSIVPYKGANDIIIDILNGSIDLGIMGLNSTIIQMVNAGKLHIVGTTCAQDMVLDGINIPSASRRLGVTSFNGFLSVDLQPSMDPARAARLTKIMWQAMQDPVVKKGMHDLFLLPDATNNPNTIKEFYKNYQIKATKFLEK